MKQWTEARDTRAILLYTAVLSFCAGVVLYSLAPGGVGVPALLFLVGLALLCKDYIAHGKVKSLVLLTLLLFCAFGSARMFAHEFFAGHELKEFEGESVVVSGRVIKDPERREKTTHLVIAVESVGDEEREGRILVFADRSVEFGFGDSVLVSGVIEKPGQFEGTGGRLFDYASYLRKDGIEMTLFAEEVQLQSRSGFSVRRSLYTLKHVFEHSIERLFAEPRAGLLEGILLGNRDALPSSLKQDFITAGLIHVVVLSGYNLTLVGAFFLWLLSRLRSQHLAMGIAALGIIAFTILVGAEATAVRAAIMALLGMGALVLRRPHAMLRGLLIAGFLMVLHNPAVLLFDPSFLLSFLATFGLITLAPFFEKAFTFIPRALGLRVIAAATVATQITVLPAILYMTGNLSFVALPANLLALVAIPLAMLGGFIAALVGFVSSVAALPFVALTSIVLSYVILIAEGVSAIPGSAVVLPEFPFGLVLLAYAGIIPLSLYLFSKTKTKKPV